MSGIADLTLYEILDERFKTGRCANGDARLDRLYDDCRWAEGPLKDRVNRWAVPLLVPRSLAGTGIFGLPALSIAAWGGAAILVVVAVLALGNRFLFAMAVGALMLSFGGWDYPCLRGRESMHARSRETSRPPSRRTACRPRGGRPRRR